jgi:mono/diheme cytochrome c family protein
LKNFRYSPWRWFFLLRWKVLRARTGVVFRVSLVIPLSLHADPLSRPESLTPAESRGKIIYTTGQSPSGGPLLYRLLSAGANVFPAKGVFCASCHGLDGKGGQKKDVVAPDITYGGLSRPSSASASSTRQRPPYTDALLARAITQGLDSSGEQLSPLMPRWMLSESELQDLLSYLKRLGNK